jgi:Bifunctional DNA primase/polymerase, N-terminal
VAKRADENRKLNAALNYARVGWPVFPVKPGAKVPAIPTAHPDDADARAHCRGECGRDGHGFRDATVDPGKIRHWWSADPNRNVGVATGAPGPDVVDVDNKGPKDNGFRNWSQLKRAGLVNGPMALIRTPSGGFHAYYKGTDQANGSLHEKRIDFRSDGGYVVSPPSTVEGKPYQIVKVEPSSATVNWEAIRQELTPAPEPRTATPGNGRSAGADHGPAATLDRVARWAAAREPGDRNFPLYYAAKQATLAGASAAEVRERLLDAARQSGLEGGDPEARRTIESGIRAADDALRPQPGRVASPSQTRPASDPEPRQAAPQPAPEPAPAPQPAPEPEKGHEPVPEPQATAERLTGPALDAEIDRLAATLPAEPADPEPADVDLDHDDVRLADGTRLTNDMVPGLVDEIRHEAEADRAGPQPTDPEPELDV